MARSMAISPSVVAGGLEDDHSLPIMQFSSLTTALLESTHSHSNNTLYSIGSPVTEDHVTGCRPSRTDEQGAQPKSFSLELSWHSSGHLKERTSLHSCKQHLFRDGKDGCVAQGDTYVENSIGRERYMQSPEERSSGSNAFRTTCRSTVSTCQDGSQGQASPPSMSIKRVGGSTLARPARRFKIVTCAPSTIGPDISVPENLAKETEAEDGSVQQGQDFARSNQAREQISSASASRPTIQSMVSTPSKRSDSIPEPQLVQTMAEKASSRTCSYDSPPRSQPVPAPTNPLEVSRHVARPMTTPRGQKRKIQLIVNHKSYLRLDCIGRGGSARVYRVMTDNCSILALKRVSLRDVDEIGVQGFKGEINLLKVLARVDRVVRLFDWEINVSANHLNLLMELGETDLDAILKRQISAENSKLDLGSIRYYWKEMLECVASVHEYGIVHSDLKPANFLVVGGRLKLIDFGIAGTIQENTINVHRENQVGTPNYMAPEALLDSNASDGLLRSALKLVRLGKPSDVWSLACILYLMVYGTQPFGHIQGAVRKVMAITNPHHVIAFPPTGVCGSEIPESCKKTLKACLAWEQDLRPTTEALLHQSNKFLFPDQIGEDKVELTLQSLTMLVHDTVEHCRPLDYRFMTTGGTRNIAIYDEINSPIQI